MLIRCSMINESIGMDKRRKDLQAIHDAGPGAIHDVGAGFRLNSVGDLGTPVT